jgi:hypothetical protein
MKAKPPTSFKETVKLFSLARPGHAKPKFVKDGACKEVIHKFDTPASQVGHPRPIGRRHFANPPTLADLPSSNAGR